MNFKVSHHDNSYTPWEATIEDGDSLDPPGIFTGDGKTIAEAIGACIIANRETLDITFDVYENGVLTSKSTYFGRSRL